MRPRADLACGSGNSPIRAQASNRATPTHGPTPAGPFFGALSSPSLGCLQQSIDLSLQLRLEIRF